MRRRNTIPSQKYLCRIFELVDGTLFWKEHPALRKQHLNGTRVNVTLMNNGRPYASIAGVKYPVEHIVWRMVHGQETKWIRPRNGNRLDTRPENLKKCTKDEYARFNRQGLPGKTSVYRGVHRASGKWHAEIFRAGKKYRLGTFDDQHGAARAYNAASVKLHGDKATLNEIDEEVNQPGRA